MRGIFDPEECFAVPNETPIAARLASASTRAGLIIAVAPAGEQSTLSDSIASENYYIPTHYESSAH